jgi:hypothetical protein
MTKKQLDLIYEKVLKRIEKRVLLDSKEFYGCETIEDVLLALGGEEWSNILYEVGYSPRFCDEVLNFSTRFCRLFDKVVAYLQQRNEFTNLIKK